MWRMRKKLVLCSVAAAIGLSAPTASADMVDDYLAKVPAGQISCEQATKYLSLIHISEPTRPVCSSRMPSSA